MIRFKSFFLCSVSLEWELLGDCLAATRAHLAWDAGEHVLYNSGHLLSGLCGMIALCLCSTVSTRNNGSEVRRTVVLWAVHYPGVLSESGVSKPSNCVLWYSWVVM